MMVERIVAEGLTLAIVLKNEDWEKDLDFLSAPEDYLQVVTWVHKKGYKLAPHIHFAIPREVLQTQEVAFVKEGRLRADIYDDDKKLVKSIELEKGDTIVLLNGGHGYEILEDDTRVLEVKTGPYLGVDKDRQRI